MSSFRSMVGIRIKVMGRRYTGKPLNNLGCVIITGKASTCCQRKTNYSENLTSLTSFRLSQYTNRVFVLNNLQLSNLQLPTQPLPIPLPQPLPHQLRLIPRTVNNRGRCHTPDTSVNNIVHFMREILMHHFRIRIVFHHTAG